jgi:hypothetical protein
MDERRPATFRRTNAIYFALIAYFCDPGCSFPVPVGIRVLFLAPVSKDSGVFFAYVFQRFRALQNKTPYKERKKVILSCLLKCWLYIYNMSNAITLRLSSIAETAAFYFNTETAEISDMANMNGSISCAILSAGLTFENEAAFSNFEGLVKITMLNEQTEVYRAAFPEFHMNEKGVYTSNSEKWA